MIKPNTSSRFMIKEIVTASYSSKPLFGVISEFFSRDNRLTRNFIIRTKSADYKLIEIRKKFHADPKSLNRFSQAIKLLKAMQDTLRVPRLIHFNETSMLVEWLDGRTLLQAPIEAAEVPELANCLFASYQLMEKKENAVTQRYLTDLLANLHSSELISGDNVRIIEKMLPRIKYPTSVLTGAALDDVALPNFLRLKDGKIVYIDVLGIVENQTMMINFRKVCSKLDTDLSENLAKELDSLTGSIFEYEDWSKLTRILNTIVGKSKKGNLSNNQSRSIALQKAIGELDGFCKDWTNKLTDQVY